MFVYAFIVEEHRRGTETSRQTRYRQRWRETKHRRWRCRWKSSRICLNLRRGFDHLFKPSSGLDKNLEYTLNFLQENPFKRRLCQIFSKDRTGKLTFEEFLDMMSALSESSPHDSRVAHAFRLFGNITWSQLINEKNEINEQKLQTTTTTGSSVRMT